MTERNTPDDTRRRRVATDYRFAPIPEELIYDPAIDHLAVRVYGALMRHGMTPDSCYPSHERIGELIGVSPRSVARPLKALESAGWITKKFRTNGHGRSSDGYYVHTAPVAERADERGTGRGLRADERGTVRADERGTVRADERDEREPVEREPVEREGSSTPSTTAAPTAKAALDFLPKSVDPDDVRAICLQLRDRCTSHHPQGRSPKITAQWVKDCGTLLNSGPLDIDGFVPTAAQVRAMIDAIFDQLAERQGARRFCWADQVNSTGALRRHWAKIELELSQSQPKRSDGAIADAVADLRRMLGG